MDHVDTLGLGTARIGAFAFTHDLSVGGPDLIRLWQPIWSEGRWCATEILKLHHDKLHLYDPQDLTEHLAFAAGTHIKRIVEEAICPFPSRRGA